MKKPQKPLTRAADGWRLATCDACRSANYVPPAAPGPAFCARCRGVQPHTLVALPERYVSNSGLAPIQ